MLHRIFGKHALVLLLLSFFFTSHAQNQALDLSGAGNEVNATYTLNTGGFTVEQWIYLPSLSAGASIINQSNSNFPSPLDVYVNSSGDINLLIGNGTGTFASVIAPGAVGVGTWHHVALVFDPAATGQECQIFIDGNSTPTATTAEPPGLANTGPIRIGRRADAFEGDDIYIDEVRIWNIARTGIQISGDYDAKLAGDETGLQVYLQFENNLNDDATGNGSQNGTIAAGSINYTPGAPLQDNALNFDGTNDRISVPRNTLATGLTFEAWVNTVSADAASGYAGNAALSVIGDVDNNIRGSFGINGGEVWYLHWTGVATDFDTIRSVQTVNDGNWHHIAVTHDQGSNEVFIYVDGQLDGQGITATYHGDMSFNRIGSSYVAAVDGDFFDGSIDEVRIWGNVRDQEQINADAYTTLGAGPGLVASYDFNQGIGGGDNGSYTTLPDLTVNGNDGTLDGPFDLNFAASNWVSSSAFTNDIFAPIFLAGYPLIDNITTSGFDITVQLNEPGTYFYVVVPDGSTPPSVDDVRGGTGFGGTGQVAAGNIAVTTASTDFVQSPSGLTPNTYYDLYIVAQDDEGPANPQNSNVVFNVTTEAGFITRWVTTDNQITIPTAGGGNYSVEWNNITNPGTNEGFIEGRTGDYTITGLENTSTYEVIIRGIFPRIYFNNLGDKDKIQSIEQWGDISWQSMEGAFFGCTNLDMAATDVPDLSAVTNMSQMFRASGTFSGDLNGWNVSTITDMSFLFSSTSFNGNISGWDVSGVSNMSYMFYLNPAFNQDISGWVTSSASNMLRMFSHTNVFNQNIGGWDVSNVTNMGTMFNQAFAFDQNIGGWDVSMVTNMEQMFRDATAFNADISSWVVSGVSVMSRMFQGASSFNQDISGWDVNATDLNNMFNNASAFDQNIGLWDVTAVTNMTSMLDNSGISVANYDAILSGWAAQSVSLQVGVTLGATGLGYSSSGESDRTTLTTAPSSWVISGDQLVTPEAPTNAIAYASSPTDITIEWTDNATNETGYTVQRAVDYAFSAPLNIATGLPINTATYTDNAGADQRFYYRVIPTNGNEDATSYSSVEFGSTFTFAGDALTFDGTDDRVSIADDDSLSFGNGATDSPFAVEAWINLDQVNSQGIISKRSGADEWHMVTSGSGQLSITLADNSASAFLFGETSGFTFQTGEWYHVAFSYDGSGLSSGIRLFINGNEETNNPGSSGSYTAMENTVSPLEIGTINSGASFNFDGQIDELKIWSFEKIDYSDRFSQPQGNEANLIAYYSMDEGSGLNVVDGSVNTNDGILQNGPVFNPSTIVQDGVVSNTNDSGPGSLREAINYANANSPTTITFNIAGVGPHIIGVTTTLPDITGAGTIIDGTSQPGWIFGDVNNMITVDGSAVPPNTSGFNINEAANVDIYGLIITGFTGLTTHAAIELTGDGADNATIGSPGMGNIIHGGGTTAIYITNADSTVIQGNWIGTLNGTTPSGNNHHGISATGTVDNLTIGGNSLLGEGNLIAGAGNGRYGITVGITGTNLTIKGNLIGTDSTGNASMNNEAGGVDIGGAVTFVVGGVGPGERNIISGNNTDTNADGINVGNSPTGSILNNYIGVGENGTTPLGNGGYGILFANSASGVLVDGNIISNNGTDGLYLGNGSSSLTVSNNIIGLTADGLTALGNTNDGIRITNGTNITISGNTISANGSDGIAINGDQTNLDINTNVIGLDINGQGDMVLLGDGVTVTNDNTFGNQANGIVLNLVDGSSAGNSIVGNVISGNGVFADQNTGSVGIGIYINADTRGFTIQDNVIGLEIDESTPQKNINSGIYISGLTNSIIGGTAANEANLIGHNGDYGIEKLGSNMDGVEVHANEFDCNEKGGISFTSAPDIDAPIIDIVSPTYISGTTTSEDNSNIFIYEADSCNADQGRLLVADSVDVVFGGAWTVNGSFQLGKYYMAVVVDDETAVNATLSTSEFSLADTIPASVVTNTNDLGAGSLRDAILFANANPGTVISFDIAGAGPWNIGLSSALPQITAANTIIDGTTQPGWVFGDSTTMVQINGSGIGGNAHGININADANEVYGLILTGFNGSSLNGAINLASGSASNARIGAANNGNIIHGTGGNGVYVQEADGVFIQGNWFGTVDGTNLSAIGNHGIATAGNADNLTIGGDFGIGEGNVIGGSGASRYGINIFNGTTLTISGNFIGTNASANGAIPNGLGGISIGGSASGVTIGGPSPGDLNVISGNTGHGIRLQAGNTIDIDGNYIGLQSDGSTALANGGSGIYIDPAPVNVNIGTIIQNFISENIAFGLFFNSNISSNTALGINVFNCNQGGGIGYNSAPLIDRPSIDNITATSAIVSSTSGDGSTVTVWLSEDGCSNDQGLSPAGFGTVASGEAIVSGAFISGQHYTAYVEDINGTSEFSVPFVPNFVAVTNENDTGVGSLRAAIDTVNASPGKAIYFNIPSSAPWEINLASDLPTITAQGTVIDGTTQPGWNIATGDIPQIIGGGSQTIGLNFTGNLFEVYGLHIRDFTAQGIRFNAVGTTPNGYIIGAPDKGNIVTGNNSAGIFILTYVGGGTVQSNYIGIMPDGTTAGMGNQNGISLGTNGDRVQIGGLSSDEMNVISNNTTAEISISNADSTIIQGNLLGLDPLETTSVGAANGINITPGSGSLIEGNVISGHTTGIRFNNASGNIVRGNAIGLASDASTPFPNTNGIHMINNLDSDNNIIGSPTNQGDVNYIGENTGNAILIEGAGNNGNQIQLNSIFNNGAGITLASGAHNGIVPPGIDPIANGSTVTGTGTNGDQIDLYYDDSNGQGITYIGSDTVATGVWSIGSLSLVGGDQLVATATNTADGTSEFSPAALYSFIYPAAEGAGESLTFDGTDDIVVIADDPSFEMGTYTLEAWVSINGNPAVGATHAFINKGTLDPSLDANGYSFGYTYDGSNYQVFIGHVDGSNVLQGLLVNYSLNIGEWYHVAAVYDGVDQILLVNGIEIGRQSAANPDYIGDATDIRIGGYHSLGGVSAGDFINAQLDEIRIWDQALQEDGIRQYIAQKVTDTHPEFASLIAYYRMDDSGDALNLTGFNGTHNGTIIGGALYNLSGAHLGDASFHEYTYPVGSGRDLDNFRVTNLGVANLPLHIYRVSGTPANNVIAGFDNIADTAYYGVFSPGQTYDVSDSIGGLTPDRRIVFRNDGADPTWTSISGVLGTDLDDDEIYAYGQFDNGQFATAIDQNPYPTPVDAGYALSLDGSSWVSIPDNDSFTPAGGGLTLELWVNPDDLVAPAEADALISKYNSIAGQSSWLLDMRNTGTLAFTLYEDVAGSIPRQIITDNPAIRAGEWNHVAATYNLTNQEIKIYVNGVEQVSTLTITNSLSGIANSNSTVRIGNVENASAGANSSRFNGDVDEVRIWDVPLTQTNIRDHMIQKIDAEFDSLNHLQAYYRFDENNASTAINIAGDSDGTITSATPVISGAPQGEGSLYSYAGSPGVLNTAQFGEDINVFYNDASAGIHAYLVGGPPNQVQADGFDDLDQGKYYGVFAPGGQKVDIRMDYNGANDPQRRIVYRTDASDNAASGGWERISGLINTSNVGDSVFAYNVSAGEVSTAVLNPPNAYSILGDTDPGDALNFDGSTQYVQLPNFNLDPSTENFTVELWAKPTALGGTDNLFVQEDGTGVGRAYLYLTGNTLASLLGGASIQSGSPTVVNNDQWYHFAVTYDGVNVTTYINGLQEAQSAVTPEAANGAFRIGSSKTGASTLTGDIDEVRVWNAALAPLDLSNFANTTDISSHPNYADMLAYYKFDDGTGSTILEDVFANNDGTLTGMDENTDWVVSGALAGALPQNALSLDGTGDFTNSGNIASVNFDRLDPFTVEAWIQTTGTGQNTIAGQQDDSGGVAVGYRLFLDNGILRMSFNNTPLTNQIVVNALNDPINDGAWHHVAMTHDGSSTAAGIQLYIDGEQQERDLVRDLLSSSTVSSANFSIGSRDAFEHYFNGLIDQVRVWDVARSNEDIYNDAYSSITSDPNLLLAFEFDQPSGAAIDAVGGNDGTLGGDATYVPSTAFDNDVFAPLFTSGFPFVDDITDNDFQINSDANESGLLSVAVYADGTPTPTADDVVNGTGAITFATALSESAVTRIGGSLASGTDYDVYFVLEDLIGNRQTVPTLVDVTTTTIDNYALDLDGVDDHLSIAHDPAFNFSGDFTISLWVNQSVAGNAEIFSKRGNATANGLIIGTLAGSYRVWASNTGSSWNIFDQTVFATAELGWTHVAVVREGGTWNFYKNGVQELSVSAAGVMANTDPITLGQNLVGVGQLDGSIDEVQIWGIARDSTTIATEYQNNLVGNEPGLIAYYQFEAGSGTAPSPDITGNGHAATHVSMEGDEWVQGPTLNAPIIPDATFATIPVAGGNVTTGSNDNLIYKFTIAASGGNITKQGLSFAVGGDAVAGDFSTDGWRLYESINSDPGVGGAVLIDSANIGDIVPDTVGFAMSGSILDGDIHYYYVTADVDAGASIGNSFNVVLWSPDPLETIGILDPKNKIDGGFVDGNSFTIQSSADVTPPNVSNLVPSINTIADGDSAFDLTVTFDEAMDTGIDPTISFVVEDPTNTLTFSGGVWDDSFNFTASYNVTDANELLSNIDVRITDAQDVSANQMGTYDDADLFNIDTENPIVTVDSYGTSITSPEITGTIDDPTATLDVEVDGNNYAGTNNGDGTWTLAAGVITSLADGTYDVIVTATDVVGNTGTDATTDELVISQTVVTLSATGVTSTSFTARWSVGLDVQTYQVDVSDVADFSSFITGFDNFETTATSVVVSNLDFSTQYYYRVRLVNTSSQVSNNSNTAQVKTAIDVETEADSLALVQVFNAISPQGLNWATERLRNWDGITLDAGRTRVEVVDINNTSSAGDMPNPFTGNALTNGGLSNMLEMNASDNQITGLMDYSGTTITNLNVSNNNLEFDDLEPVAGITTVDYSNQASIQFNESSGGPIEVRYTNDYSLSITAGGSNNVYTWYRNDVQISSGADFILNNATNVILAIDYDNMGTFRTEITSSLVPGLTIDVDPQAVLAIADMQVSVTDSNGDPLTAPLDAFMLETTRTATGFSVLETLEDVNTSTFTFPDVVLGNYIILVESDLTLYIPTYFGDVFEWTEADTLFFRSDDIIDMTMTEVPAPLGPGDGDGTLDVLIEEDFGDDAGRIDARRRAAKRKCGVRRKRSGGRTDQDDDEFELIAYGETDDNGEFQFGFLPQGTYRFFVEYPGIPIDESSFVEFEVGEAGVSDTDFKLEAFATEDGIEINIEKVLGIILEYFKDLEIYPNPSSDFLNIRYRHLKSGDVTAQLVDLSGNTKWSEDLRNGFDGQLRIDVTDFEEGIYILRFYDRESPNDNVVSFRVIVKD